MIHTLSCVLGKKNLGVRKAEKMSIMVTSGNPGEEFMRLLCTVFVIFCVCDEGHLQLFFKYEIILKQKLKKTVRFIPKNIVHLIY